MAKSTSVVRWHIPAIVSGEAYASTHGNLRPLSISFRFLIVPILLMLPGYFALADELPSLIFEPFQDGKTFTRWETSDPDPNQRVWKIEEEVEKEPQSNSQVANCYLRVTGPSSYQPPHRSPHSFALVKDLVVSDFDLTVRLKNTHREAGAHRDLCLFFGFQDPRHYYYVHLGAVADPHACQVFIVNDAPRTKITRDEATGTPWDDDWHTVKIVRRIKEGSIEVFFDRMDKPYMTAVDTTFTWGQVGLGTFDDHGNFDDFDLRGTRVPQGGP
jgi:hypothetical protein